MAQFCIAMRMTPAEYWALNHDETVALIDEFNKQNKRR